MTLVKDILTWFEGRGNKIQLGENQDGNIQGPKAIEEANAEHISFLGAKYENQVSKLIEETKASVVILSENLSVKLTNSHIAPNIIFSKDAKADLIAYCEHFLNFGQANESTQVDSTAIIHAKATLGKNTHIGAYVVLEEDVVIGDNVTIDAYTLLKKGTKIGNNVKIGAGNIIGGVGFGYVQDEDKVYRQFPHFGHVIIHDNVEIGNNNCIDRGSLSDTILGNGVKVDNNVHIAHNVKIGENSLVIANSMIAGSVNIGKNCWIAPSSCIRNGISLGNNVTIGLASTVTKSVENDQTVLGSPALSLEEFTKFRKFQKRAIEE